MGHVTIVHEDLNEARTIAEEVKKKIRVIAWFENEMIWKFEN
jgi:5-(carboxyamino)imidazole ribonucleotide synthase